MSNCAICGITERESILMDGIWAGSIKKVCSSCQKKEKIPIIKKPTEEQIQESKKIPTVKEIMGKLSGNKQDAKDSFMTHKNLAKLRFPDKKQDHEDLVYNYNWILKQARRRKKISIEQVSQATGVEKDKLELLENGQLFEGFQESASMVEGFLDIKILNRNSPENRKKFMQKELKEKQSEILNSVRNKIESQKRRGIFSKEVDYDENGSFETKHDVIDLDDIKHKKYQESLEKKERLKHDLENGDIDFSNEDEIKDINIGDLAELKKEKD